MTEYAESGDLDKLLKGVRVVRACLLCVYVRVFRCVRVCVCRCV